MKYGDLIQFHRAERIDGVRASASAKLSQQLVATYYLSEGISHQLTNIVFPHLRLGENPETKPILLLGGPGTGKSHLLSVITSLAESTVSPDLPASPEVTLSQQTGLLALEGAEAVAGRFITVRAGARLRDLSLREALTNQLSFRLSTLGIQYAFPPALHARDVGRAFRDMMTAFKTAFPEQGLLLVADELQDYMAVHTHAQWVEDLDFLLSMTAACRETDLRFMMGLRKSVVETPHSHAVEERLIRLKSAFEPVRIASLDVRDAAAHRLVPKTPEQKVCVAEHLGRYAPWYGGMADRMDEFVASFPIHPDYFEVIGSLPFEGAQQVLVELSTAVERLLDKPVPGDSPGLIAYDDYWDQLCCHPVISQLPEVEAVVKCGKQLEGKVRAAATISSVDIPFRLIHALCIRRLLTDGAHPSHGLTPAELRDQLCLTSPGTESSADDQAGALLSRVTEALALIHEQAGEALTGRDNEYHLNIRKLRRFVAPELVLHWINAVPFLILMLTGGGMLLSRFIHIEPKWFSILFTTHKICAATWVIGVPASVLMRAKLHWQQHLRSMLSWGPGDLVWMVQSIRSLYDKKAVVPDAGRFNTGQKINACLVMMYFAGFSTTGLVMLWKASILAPWYLHTMLFFASMGSVGGHLFLALVNPSTRIALAGIFHGWAPIEYIEHHHPLSLPANTRAHRRVADQITLRRALSFTRVEIVIVVITAILAGTGLLVFSRVQHPSLETLFSKSFVAAIKPAELSTKHQIGEVTRSCTKCHSYAGEIPNAKCEYCHPLIKDRRAREIGYHGTLKGDCIQCHKEHLEPSQSIIPLDRKKFDHRLTAFPRDGKHATLECDECHRKKRAPGTQGGYYIGLKSGLCTDCHRDPHGSQFKQSCDTCHTAHGWKGQNLKFDHKGDPSFQLLGKHTTLECAKCHKPKSPWSSLSSATFKGLPTSCVGCHKDPHRKQFTAACTTCHTQSGWKKGFLLFDHNRDSKFPLVAKHLTTDCAKCHKPETPWSPLASATFKGLPTGCTDCHKEPHRKQFTAACTTCHTPAGWKKEFVSFDHNRDSKFPLVAKHAQATCDKCHTPSAPGEALGFARFTNLKTACADCHQDPHRGQFERNCTRCHAGPTTWKFDLNHFNHNKDTKFVLVGKHVTLDCIKCHKPQTPGGPLGSATFRGLGTTCQDCHPVKHPESYGPSCMACHTLDVWPKKMKEFEHLLKNGLADKHLSLKCSVCHNEKRMPYPIQSGKTKFTCYSCHQANDPHKGTLGTECAKCHSMTGWKGEHLIFDHNKMTRYTLDRDHQNVPCLKCHVRGRWKPLGMTCQNCHTKFFKKTTPGEIPANK